MPSSGMGSQYYSISSTGMALFQQGKIETGLGGVTLDLASAPIPPGEYRLEISTAMGGVEIYLPRYVQFTIDGSSVMGSKNIHEGLDWWKSMTIKFQEVFRLSNQIPDHAVAPISQEQPVIIHFFINTGMGGVDIFRL